MKKHEKPKSFCYGLTNRCDDGAYILFADYDKIYLEVLLKELANVYKRFKPILTRFAIFESSPRVMTKKGALGSFHVVSFGKIPYAKMREVLSYMTVDDDFYRLPKSTAYRTNTLRVSPKFDYKKPDVVLKDAPRFLAWFPLEQGVSGVEVSNAHLSGYSLYVEDFDPEGLKNYVKDDCFKIELKKYFSRGG